MAERRMFSKTIIDSDLFLDMPLSAQALYFHLSMRGDDDGFINNPKKIQRMIGSSDDDLKLLIAKQFIIPFESGIVVIKHWKIHNYIRNDRYKETICKAEKAQIIENEDRVYEIGIPSDNRMDTFGIPSDNQVVYQLETQDRLGKDRLGKDSIDREKEKKESINYQEIVNAYNETCVSLPSIKKLSDKRKNKIKARLKSFTIDDFNKLFKKVQESKFLTGDNDKGWRANFDWLIEESNMLKVLEGYYEDRKSKQSISEKYKQIDEAYYEEWD